MTEHVARLEKENKELREQLAHSSSSQSVEHKSATEEVVTVVTETVVTETTEQIVSSSDTQVVLEQGGTTTNENKKTVQESSQSTTETKTDTQTTQNQSSSTETQNLQELVQGEESQGQPGSVIEAEEANLPGASGTVSP